jgi:flagellar motor protein MotB
VRDYRRGVLLGLSLAEVFILLLFCFLLLIAPRLAPQPGEGTVGEAPPPLTADQRSDKDTAVDVPLTLDSIPLTPGLNDESLLPTPLVENPLESGVAINEGFHNGGTSNAIVKVEQFALEEAAGEAFQDHIPSSDSSTGLSEADTTMPDQSADDAQPELSGEHNWPPIIPLDEAAGYSFDTGSAELSDSFADKLKSEIRQRILDHLRDYKADVVEVVGHTDERPINGASNLDNSLIGVFSGQVPAARLSAADNVGLGMARAAAVAQVLQLCIELEDIKVIPYSGGQVIERGDRLATGQNSGDRSERRRIEIRVRRSTEPVQ